MIERFRKMRRRHRWLLAGLALAAAAWWFAFPDPLFDTSYSVVVEDHRGQLLGARIAADGQWRFPVPDSVPRRFAEALIAFEDKRFRYHPGIDPLALLRAFRQNLRAGTVVSGGSTLTMQVMRMAGGPGARTFGRKLWEMLMAVRLELSASKDEILRLYAAHAPFGGNVVGLEAAAWRYFGKRPDRLSWAEAATLAVLPNAPALIHPGRRRDALQHKRDRLLQRLCAQGTIDSLSLQLALAEPLPEAPAPLPDLAPHLTEWLRRQHPGGGRFRTTLDADLQTRVAERVAAHAHAWAGNGVHNAAALVLDTHSGAVRAWVGNAPGCGPEHDE
ncbi:MAG: penicillin-binding protein 1C, partial [Alphaproteobacteria bacterium]